MWLKKSAVQLVMHAEHKPYTSLFPAPRLALILRSSAGIRTKLESFYIVILRRQQAARHQVHHPVPQKVQLPLRLQLQALSFIQNPHHRAKPE